MAGDHKEMPRKKGNESNQASKKRRNLDTTGRINPGDRPREFKTVLSDALRQKLAGISLPEQKTYVSAIVNEIVERRLTKGGKAIIKPMLMFFDAAAERTEAKPAQPVLIPGTNVPIDPEERVNMVKRIIARGLERAEQFKDR
jgi:hypothetical protein